MNVEAKYVLPFDSNIYPVRISQGNNGPWTHFAGNTSDLTHAVDFALPLGTEVKAARSGFVFDFWLDSTWVYEGLDPGIGTHPPFMSTNFIIIEHDDGTRAWYSHLGRTPFVQRKQSVEVGSIIGITGKSGWIAQIPHLHFHVFGEKEQRDIFRTIEIAFQNYLGSLDHKTLANAGKIWFGE